MNKECLVKTLAIGIVFLFVGAGVVSAYDINLINEYKPLIIGNTLYVGGSGPGNYSTIQGAINDANPGDTVFVYDDSSPYHENILIDKSINLIGEEKNTTIIDGGYELSVIEITADKITISGFNIRRADFGIDGSTNYSTIYNTIIDCWQGGIFLLTSSKNVISDNQIINTHEVCIALFYDSKNNKIMGNSLKAGSEVAIYLVGRCNKNRIEKNSIENNIWYGIWVDWSFFNIIQKNNFLNNEVHSYFENASFNFWIDNYWDDWSSKKPRPINGIRYGYFSKNQRNWTTYDWRPAQEPYDITMGV
jgi:parallel beta-helix repeat protein